MKPRFIKIILPNHRKDFLFAGMGAGANTDAVLVTVFLKGAYPDVIGEIQEMTGTVGRSFTPITPIVSNT